MIYDIEQKYIGPITDRTTLLSSDWHTKSSFDSKQDRDEEFDRLVSLRNTTHLRKFKFRKTNYNG